MRKYSNIFEERKIMNLPNSRTRRVFVIGKPVFIDLKPGGSNAIPFVVIRRPIE
uniref:Uncharacterized protein n=1 Tax=viral metagenome TaxID=1070528 RepID=A0A6M3JFC6_9ZZZZ